MSDLISRNKLFENIKGVEVAWYLDGDYTTYDDTTIMDIIEEQPSIKAQTWIPCSERLPEIHGRTSDTVLVCTKKGNQYMAFWCEDEQWRFCECGTAKEPMTWAEIIAWMPLPEPYKGE